MFKRYFFFYILILAVFTLTACGKTANQAAITGVIAHTHRMTIPAGDTVTVRIEDTTKTDSPGKKIAEELIESQGVMLPIPFAIVYDPGKINPDHTYTLHVEIDDGTGTLLYTNLSSVPVLTHGNPTHDIKVTVVLPNE